MFLNTINDRGIAIYNELLNRYYYSLKNNFKDKNGNICVIYTQKELMLKFNFSKVTIIKYLKELEDKGYIIQRKQGYKQSNLIYFPKKQEDIKDKLNSLKNENLKSILIRRTKNLIKENKINTEQNNKNSLKKSKPTIKQNDVLQQRKNKIREIKKDFIQKTIDKFKQNICYSEFKNNDFIDEYIRVISKSLCFDKIKVNKKFISINDFCDTLLRLSKDNIIYVYDCISKVKTKILNKESYLLTSIYNSINYSKTKINRSKNSNNINTPQMTGIELEKFLMKKNSFYDDENIENYSFSENYLTISLPETNLEEFLLSKNDLDNF